MLNTRPRAAILRPGRKTSTAAGDPLRDGPTVASHHGFACDRDRMESTFGIIQRLDGGGDAANRGIPT